MGSDPHSAGAAGRLSADRRASRRMRRGRHATLVEDDRARSRQRPPGHLEMVTAQQQVRRVVPARCRRHDRDNGGPGLAAAGALGIPQRAPVNGGPGGPPGIGRFAAPGGVPPEETAHKGRFPQASRRGAGSEFPSQKGRKARDCLTRGPDGRGAVRTPAPRQNGDTQRDEHEMPRLEPGLGDKWQGKKNARNFGKHGDRNPESRVPRLCCLCSRRCIGGGARGTDPLGATEAQVYPGAACPGRSASCASGRVRRPRCISSSA